MGAETLEETVFLPMWKSVKGALSQKRIGLFGSWGWGGGVWMEDWRAEALANDADVVGTVIAHHAPDKVVNARLELLGEKLAK